eukprot:7383711-Prymnesium_polylepis.2
MHGPITLANGAAGAGEGGGRDGKGGDGGSRGGKGGAGGEGGSRLRKPVMRTASISSHVLEAGCSRDADQQGRAATGRISARENCCALPCRVEDLHTCDKWCAERLKYLDGRRVHGTGEPYEKPFRPPSLDIWRPC